MKRMTSMFFSRLGSVALLLAGATSVAQATTSAVAAEAAGEPLDWYGDASAPNFSGVWIRLDIPPSSASASKEGWLPWPPPLKHPFATIWRKRLADAAAGKRTDDPVRGCMPPGMPRFVTGTNGPMIIMQTPGRVTLYRDGAPVRRIWLDGRGFPAAKDLESFSNGNALGRYEHGDFVTELRGIKDQPVDSTGVPHSNSLVITERFHHIDANRIRIDVTLNDPIAYTRPMTSSVTYVRFDNPFWEPKEFLCKPGVDYHPEKFVR